MSHHMLVLGCVPVLYQMLLLFGSRSRGGGGGAEGHSYMKVVYMYRPAFKNGGGGLGRGPSPKIGGFQCGPPSLKNGEAFGTKNNKETYILKGIFWNSPGRKSGTNKCIFLKRGVFRSGPGRKSGVFRSGPGRIMGRGGEAAGFRAAHTRTTIIWDYPLPPPPRPRRLGAKILTL